MTPTTYLALTVVVAVSCQVVASRLRIPSLLLLLIVGFGLGNVVTADAVLGTEVLFAGVTLSVGLILFEGALTLRLRRIRDLGRPILMLCTLTVAIAWGLITVLGMLLGFDLRVALLLGALLVVTGPTVIGPILRTLRPTRRVSQLLLWEGIVVDPLGAVLALLVYTAVTTVDRTAGVVNGALAVASAVGTAALIAVPIGFVLAYLLRRHTIPDFLHGVVLLAAAVGSLVLSNVLVKESGLLTVTVLGIVLANRAEGLLEPVTEFMENLQTLFVGALFIMLAGRITPGQVMAIAPVAAVFVLGLIVVVRPVSIQLGLLGTQATRRERLLMSLMAPRGIVAAAVTSVFALEFRHAGTNVRERAVAETNPERAKELIDFAVRLDGLADQVDRVVPLVFLVIVATVAVYGLGIGRLAERLGLAAVDPRGVLFSSSPLWVVSAAQALHKLHVPTLVATRQGSTSLGPSVPASVRSRRTSSASTPWRTWTSPGSGRWSPHRGTTTPTRSPARRTVASSAGPTSSRCAAPRLLPTRTRAALPLWWRGTPSARRKRRRSWTVRCAPVRWCGPRRCPSPRPRQPSTPPIPTTWRCSSITAGPRTWRTASQSSRRGRR